MLYRVLAVVSLHVCQTCNVESVSVHLGSPMICRMVCSQDQSDDTPTDAKSSLKASLASSCKMQGVVDGAKGPAKKAQVMWHQTGNPRPQNITDSHKQSAWGLQDLKDMQGTPL